MWLLEVAADQLGHLEHRHLVSAAEDGLELVVRVDHAAVFLVLQAIALDIAPDLLGHFGARHCAGADHGSKHCARRHRLHECCIWLTLLATLLRLLLRHLDSPLNGTFRYSIQDLLRWRAAVATRFRILRCMSTSFIGGARRLASAV